MNPRRRHLTHVGETATMTLMSLNETVEEAQKALRQEGLTGRTKILRVAHLMSTQGVTAQEAVSTLYPRTVDL